MGKKIGIGCLGVIGLLIILFIIGAIAGGNKTVKEEAARNAQPATQVTAGEVAKAYQENEAAAQAKYGDKPLIVSGKIAGITLDFADDPVVQLATDNEFMPANAALIEADHAKAQGLKKGQNITLRCEKVAELASMPQFSDCAIQ